jgi:hypothetical protein
MRGPREIRQKSSIMIKMTISKNVLPLTSPPLSGPGESRAILRRLVIDRSFYSGFGNLPKSAQFSFSAVQLLSSLLKC